MSNSIDLLDRKILTRLNQDVRMSYSEIAKKTRSSKEVVQYRVKRLLKRGIIEGFVTIFSLGYWAHKILVQFEKIGSSEEKEVIAYLVQHPYTNWVTPCSGSWDLIFAIMAKDPQQLDIVLRGILQKIGKYIQNYKMSISVGSQTFGHTYLLGIVKEDKTGKREHPQDFVFDKKDRKIARILHQNARAPFTMIHQRTNIPIETIRYRIRRLREAGIIRRHRLIIDETKLGYTRYEVFIRCINLTDAVINTFAEYGKQNKHISFFSKCVGEWDIEYTAHFKTNEELRNFVLDVKRHFGEHITKFVVVTLFKTYNYIYLPEELR